MKYKIENECKVVTAADLRSGQFFFDSDGDLNLKIDGNNVVGLSSTGDSNDAITPWIRSMDPSEIVVSVVLDKGEGVTLYSM